MKRTSGQTAQPGTTRPRDAEVEARSGVVKKAVRPEPRTMRGKSRAVLPKVTGKVLKTFVDDFTIVRAQGRAVSRIVGRGQPKETA